MALTDAWNPSDYQQFASERTRPASELIGRISLSAPEVIADLGCGTGNVTRLLAEKWPQAHIVGVDSSQSMLDTAAHAVPSIEWVHADVGSWLPDTSLDAVFSNAALHWLDDHHRLFPRLAGLIRPGGILAVQMPCNFDQPMHHAIAETVVAPQWSARLHGLVRSRPVLPPEDYVCILSECTTRADVWETTYYHVLSGANPVVTWAKGAALRPYLAQLDESEQRQFLQDYGDRVRPMYSRTPNGETILPFRRLFIIAQR